MRVGQHLLEALLYVWRRGADGRTTQFLIVEPENISATAQLCHVLSGTTFIGRAGETVVRFKGVSSGPIKYKRNNKHFNFAANRDPPIIDSNVGLWPPDQDWRTKAGRLIRPSDVDSELAEASAVTRHLSAHATQLQQYARVRWRWHATPRHHSANRMVYYASSDECYLPKTTMLQLSSGCRRENE